MSVNFVKTLLYSSIPLLISFAIYKNINYVDVVVNMNHNMVKANKWFKRTFVNDKLLLNNEIKINNNIYYTIKLKEYEFVIFDKDKIDIDINEYNDFRKSLIMTKPDDIIMANLSLIKDIPDIDIVDYIKELCGPFLRQINEKNKYLISEYITNTHLTGISQEDIDNISIMFSDGNEITLDYK